MKGFRPLSALASLSAIVALLSFAPSALAQEAMYPLKEGIVQPLHSQNIPS